MAEIDQDHSVNSKDLGTELGGFHTTKDDKLIIPVLIDFDLILNTILIYQRELWKLFKKEKHFENYIKITTKFNSKQIDDEFKRIFFKFYGFERNFTQKHKEKYFTLFNSKLKDISIEKIIKELMQVTEKKSCFLVYASKLMHTFDNQLIIYDNYIKSMFCIKDVQEQNIELRIKKLLTNYDSLVQRFKDFANYKNTSLILKEFRKELKVLFEDDHQLVSDTKLLDSILWGLVKLTKKNQIIFSRQTLQNLLNKPRL